MSIISSHLSVQSRNVEEARNTIAHFEFLTKLNDQVNEMLNMRRALGEMLSSCIQNNHEYAWEILKDVAPKELVSELRQTADLGRKIDAIKLVRSYYGMGLGEAKWMMDVLFEESWRMPIG